MMNDQRQLETLHAQRASAWVEVLRQPTARQRAEFIAWLKESPRNVRDFLAMYALDGALGEFDAERHHDIESLLAQADRNITHIPNRFRRATLPDSPRRRWHGIAAAASLALVALCVWLLMPNGQSWQEFATVAGEQRAFELEDGSVMYLNTRSRVALRFSEKMRDIRLIEGEALFRVHHDPNAPFRVHTNTAVIQAIGTQFNVYAQAGGTRVAVIEGRVKVSPEITGKGVIVPADIASSSPPSVSLAANEVAQIDRGGTVSVHAVENATDAVAWRERRLIFREDSLATIVQEFNRYNREQIVLDDAAIATRTYTGVFDADDPESLVEVLAREPDLTIEQARQKILIRAR